MRHRMNMYIPTLRRIYARVHSPLSSPFPSSSVTVLPVCPSMRLSSPLCTRFDVTSLILFHIYIYTYTRRVYIRALCKHSACNDDVAPRVPASSSNRSTAVSIRAERWLWFVTLALASPAPRNQRIDRRMKHQRPVIGGWLTVFDRTGHPPDSLILIPRFERGKVD